MQKKNIPQCIGIIMDGNRRWAKEQGISTVEGHRFGYKKLGEVLVWAQKADVQYLIIYAFSTENWKRAEKEVSYLLDLFNTVLKSEIYSVIEKGVRVRFIGERTRFSKDLQKMMTTVEEKSERNTKLTLVPALSYGGRAEILHATNSFIKEKRTKPVTEEEFDKKLWTKDIPDPDLIIRTGETMRLSNFLPWQSVYSELYFTSTFWPDFDKEEFDYILEEYGARARRMGK